MSPSDSKSDEDRIFTLTRIIKYQHEESSRSSTVQSAVTSPMSLPSRHSSDAEVEVTVEKVN